MNNRASKGGGICRDTTVDGQALNCIIFNNSAKYGGGIYASFIRNCTVVSNVATVAGGGAYGYTNMLYVTPGIPVILATSSSGTLASSSAELSTADWITIQYGTAYNSIIWGNMASISNDLYNVKSICCCASNCPLTDGNMTVDPQFRICEDGRILIRADSPCIDVGANSNVVGVVDYCGNNRIVNGIVDIGAIEWQGYESVNANFVWQSGGNLKWDIDYNQDNSNLGCFVSGNISHGQQTWIETTVKGAGTISFDWKVSSEARFDTLSIYVDGERKRYISGTTDWATVSISIDTLANHTVKWVYSKSASGTSGDDCGWVGNVKWIPDVEMNRMVLSVNSDFGNPSPSTGNNNFSWGDEIEMSVAPSFVNETVRGICRGWSGSGSVPSSGSGTNLVFAIQEPSIVTWNWDVEYLVQVSATAYGNVDIERAWVADGANITITATPNESCGGFRWCGDIEGATINGYAITIPVNRAKAITAEFLPPSYGSALGIGSIELSSGGDAVWTIDNSESALGDGVSCRSGEINGQGVSYLEMTVTGPGTLSFMWKLSLGSSVAGIDLLVDGEFIDGLMDETDWVEFVYPISSGTHTVRWEFYHDGAEHGDYACVDHVAWTGSAPASSVVFAEMLIEGDTNWVADADCEMRQYRLVGKTQAGDIYMLNADKWQMMNWSADNNARFEDYYDLSKDGAITMKSCGYTGCGTLMATYGDARESLLVRTSHSPRLSWDAICSSNLAYPGALVELSNSFVVTRSDGSTKEIVGFEGLGKCELHFKQLPIRSSSNAFGDDAPRIVDGHWLRVPKNADYISSKTAFYMYVEACANGTSESQFFIIPFAWYSSEPVTKTTEVPVPYEWLIKHYYYAINTNPDEFESQAWQQTGKRDITGRLLTVADDYVAGTDPRDMESVFKAYIDISEGNPVISWKPDLNENGTKESRVYTTYGSKEIGGEWQDMSKISDFDKGDYHFFKVTVEMPKTVPIPQSVVASFDESYWAVDLSWNTVDTATYYEIWRSASESFGEATRIASVTNATEFSDRYATAGEEFYYWIRAVADNGKGSKIDEPVKGKRKLEQKTITFDGNGGIPSSNSGVFIAGNPYGSLPTAYREGYDFTGWYADPKIGIQQKSDSVYGGITTTLYAHWKAHTYAIHFEPNGGEGIMPDLAMTYDIALPLSLNVFSHQSLVFAGWAETPTSPYSFTNGALVKNLSVTDNGVVNLYAIWQPISPPSSLQISRDAGQTYYITTPGAFGRPGIKQVYSQVATVALTWGIVEGATSYEVWNSTSPSVDTATLAATCTDTSYSASREFMGRTWYFWIKAVKNDVSSNFSGAVSIGW